MAGLRKLNVPQVLTEIAGQSDLRHRGFVKLVLLAYSRKQGGKN